MPLFNPIPRSGFARLASILRRSPKPRPWTGGGEDDLAQLVDAIPALIWTLTPEGRPCYINRRLCEWLGIPARRIADEPREDLALEVCTALHPDESEAVLEQLERSLTSARPFSMHYRQRRLGGDFRWVESTMEPAFGPDGEVRRWYGVARDIEAEVLEGRRRRETRELHTRADRAATMAEMSAAIAHEVNQPLAAILADAGACGRWLERTPPDLARARRLASRIADQTEAASQIVSRTSALFRRDIGDQVLTEIGGVVESARLLMEEEVRAARAVLATDLDAAAPMVRVDPVQIRQLLVNLIRNALEAMNDARAEVRRLVVRTRLEPEFLRLEVADSGPGVEEVGRIFDPFFTTKINGAGMGLAICRSIAHAHEGRLWVEPNAPAGARFCVHLPLASVGDEHDARFP